MPGRNARRLPAFPLAATYEAARAASPAFGECGAVAVLSGDVATALRVVQPGSGPNGTVGTVDAVSGAWAERFARALAPLREAEPAAPPEAVRCSARPFPCPTPPGCWTNWGWPAPPRRP
ncbi:hypothetical protein PQR15_22190 [Streptomyces lydicus]|nr:hypothetical protein [Streptomyces lydicus]